MAKQTEPLPPFAPDREDSRHTQLAWINEALRREQDRIVNVERFGVNADSRIRIDFEHGGFWRGQQRELLGTNGLRHALLLYDGHRLPAYNQADLLAIVSRIIVVATSSIRDDDQHQLIEDVGSFLARSLEEAGLVRGEHGYALISDLARFNRRRDGRPGSPAPALALDTSAGALWVPRGPFALYLRELRSTLHPPALRAGLEELGWQHGNFQRRQPQGEARPKVKVWVVDPSWESCPFDLTEAVESAPNAIGKRS